MSWQAIASMLNYDQDTVAMLEITEKFLQTYFSHSAQESQAVIRGYLENYTDCHSEDTIHHEMPYRLAAIMHYLIFLKGSPTTVGDWLLATGHSSAPQEALEYFRRNYYFRA